MKDIAIKYARLAKDGHARIEFSSDNKPTIIFNQYSAETGEKIGEQLTKIGEADLAGLLAIRDALSDELTAVELLIADTNI